MGRIKFTAFVSSTSTYFRPLILTPSRTIAIDEWLKSASNCLLKNISYFVRLWKHIRKDSPEEYTQNNITFTHVCSSRSSLSTLTFSGEIKTKIVVVTPKQRNQDEDVDHVASILEPVEHCMHVNSKNLFVKIFTLIHM